MPSPQRAAEVFYTWQEKYLNKDPQELSFYPHFYAERESGVQQVCRCFLSIWWKGWLAAKQQELSFHP